MSFFYIETVSLLFGDIFNFSSVSFFQQNFRKCIWIIHKTEMAGRCLAAFPGESITDRWGGPMWWTSAWLYWPSGCDLWAHRDWHPAHGNHFQSDTIFVLWLHLWRMVICLLFASTILWQRCIKLVWLHIIRTTALLLNHNKVLSRWPQIKDRQWTNLTEKKLIWGSADRWLARMTQTDLQPINRTQIKALNLCKYREVYVWEHVVDCYSVAFFSPGFHWY